MPVLLHAELLSNLLLIQNPLLPFLRMRPRQDAYHAHCTRAWGDPELAALKIFFKWSGRPGSSVGVGVQKADADTLLALWRVWFVCHLEFPR